MISASHADRPTAPHLPPPVYGVSRGVYAMATCYDVDVRALVDACGTTMVLVEHLLEHLESRRADDVRFSTQMRLFALLRGGAVRDYQQDCANRARGKSGFVVAPCGSGKTLIGLLIGVLNGGRMLILTTRYTEQWLATLRAHFAPLGAVGVLMYADADDADFARDGLPHVVIGTYSLFATGRQTTKARLIRQIGFTTVVLDEAHGAASAQNMHVLRTLRGRHFVMLTATKIREDLQLEKLEATYGGTIVEVDRRALVAAGHVADVRCVNLIVPYTDAIESIVDRTTALAIHPNKALVLRSTLRQLAREGHKILVFCDDLFCLHWMHALVRSSGDVATIGAISMATPVAERASMISRFSDSAGPCALFLSRTGDEALDVPSASAGVVFWNHWASRRQIVQRIGRITRSSRPSTFVALVCDDATELERSRYREAYVAAHGFDVINVPHAESAYGATPLKAAYAKYSAMLESAWRRRRRDKRPRAP